MPPSPPRKTWSLTTRMRLGLVFLFIPVLLLGTVYYLHMERTLHREQENNLIARNNQFFHTLLEPYLKNLERQFTLIYQQVNYQDFSGQAIRNGEHYLQQWQAYRKVMDLDYVYVGTEQRQMLIHPAWQADAAFDPRTRPWYRLAAEHPGKMVWVEPYYDYTLGTLTMALARVIEDPAGKRVGVLSMDTQLAPLSSWLNHAHQLDEHGEQGYQLLLTHEGIQLAHPDPKQLFKPLPHPEWLSRMPDEQGFFLDNKSGSMVAYHRIPQQRWILLSVTPTASLHQVVDSVTLNVLGMIALASILYLLLALRWSRYFTRMLKEISSLIRASIKGDHHDPEHQMSELSTIYAEMEAAGKLVADVRQQAHQDQLTGLYNRRFFDECLQQQLVSGAPFGVVMFDLDDFKRVNDTYGHQAGDVVLKRVSKLGMQLFDQWGWFCRYGGEELVLIFRLDTQMSEIVVLLEAFRNAVEKLEWREQGLTVTISGGAAISHSGLSAKELVELADKGVYQAKREGKNRICFTQRSVSDQMDEEPHPHLDKTRRHAH
ncbi:sensor domain-containing diguanylate cyclase [Aeromonas aquatilis]